jgi:hypothetical protein
MTCWEGFFADESNESGDAATSVVAIKSDNMRDSFPNPVIAGMKDTTSGYSPQRVMERRVASFGLWERSSVSRPKSARKTRNYEITGNYQKSKKYSTITCTSFGERRDSRYPLE